ncbi:MAG: hypothetical protein HQK97_12170 [Nitrospirae bacterium]|nr:hypothetical protein [Nitrospirota bacterium]
MTNLIGYAGLPLFKITKHQSANIKFQRPTFTLKNIFMERITPYVNRSEELLTFLDENSKPGQTLLVAGYGSDFPVIYYTKLKVIRVEHAITQSMEMPDWIFPQTVSGINEYFNNKRLSIDIAAIAEFLKSNYDMIKIEVHDSSPVGSVPEPDVYEYFTAPDKINVIAFKRKAL